MALKCKVHGKLLSCIGTKRGRIGCRIYSLKVAREKGENKCFSNFRPYTEFNWFMLISDVVITLDIQIIGVSIPLLDEQYSCFTVTLFYMLKVLLVDTLLVLVLIKMLMSSGIAAGLEHVAVVIVIVGGFLLFPLLPPPPIRAHN